MFFAVFIFAYDAHTHLKQAIVLSIELCCPGLLLFLIPRTKVDYLATVLCCLPSDIFLGDRNFLSFMSQMC